MSNRYGVIGSSLGHSLSPVIFQFLFGVYNINAEYDLLETDLASLPDLLAAMRTKRYTGANVTFPYKEAIVPFLDELHGEARQIGAVNTITFYENKLIGFNTDMAGFTAALCDLSGLHFSGKTAVIIGAGGAARACLRSLIKGHADEIIILSRTLLRQRGLVELSGKSKKRTQIHFSSISCFSKIRPGRRIGLVINATSAPKADLLNILESIFNRSITGEAVWLDLNYGSRAISRVDTGLFAEYHDGLYLLAAQAAESFYIWTGLKVDTKRIYEYLSYILTRNCLC